MPLFGFYYRTFRHRGEEAWMRFYTFQAAANYNRSISGTLDPRARSMDGIVSFKPGVLLRRRPRPDERIY